MPSLKKIIQNLQSNKRVKASVVVQTNNLEILNQSLTGATFDPFRSNSNQAYICFENEEFPKHFNHKTSLELAIIAKERGTFCFVGQIGNNYDFIDLDRHCLILSDNLNRLSGFLALEAHSDPFKNMFLVGITGTKGKTTTSQLASTILNHAKKRVGIIGSIGIFYPEYFEDPGFLSNPHSTEIFEIGTKFKNQKVEYVIMEITSHGAVLERNSALEFDIIILTNMASEHLNFHKSLDHYQKAKMLYFERINECTKKPVVIFNKDDPSSSNFIALCTNTTSKEKLRMMTYSLKDENSSIFALVKSSTLDGSTFNVSKNGELVFNLQLPLPGLFNVYNALCAICISLSLEISWDTIRSGLLHQKEITGRFERIENDLGILVIVDFAHTHNSFKSILESVRSLNIQSLITVFGCGGDKDKAKRPAMGEITAQISDVVFITADNPRHENLLDIIDDIKKGIAKEYKHKVQVELDRKLAIKKALSIAKAGDAVLLLGKGREKYQVYGDAYLPFSDVGVTKEFFEQVKPTIS